MNYYTIDWDYSNLTVIGHYPQTTFKKGYDPSLPNGFWQINPNEFPNFSPHLELTIHKKANPTDFIQRNVNFGMIISKNFKRILCQFNLPPYKLYPICVFHKGKQLEYYWFHFIVTSFFSQLDKTISKASIYNIKKIPFEPVSNIDLSLDLEQLKEIDASLPWYQEIKWEQLSFTNSFPQYDVYETQLFDFNTLISERLLSTLLNEGMTGFTYKLYDKIR